jgi:hypothetical protein
VDSTRILGVTETGCDRMSLKTCGKSRHKLFCWYGACLSLTAALAGCGGSAASVNGKLTLDGEPLAGSNRVRVTIMFYPQAGGVPAAALADEQGRYSLSTGSRVGLAPGDYVVVVAATESEAPAYASTEPRKRVITPARYADPKKSMLSAKVKPGRNTFDFDLTSRNTG